MSVEYYHQEQQTGVVSGIDTTFVYVSLKFSDGTYAKYPLPIFKNTVPKEFQLTGLKCILFSLKKSEQRFRTFRIIPLF